MDALLKKIELKRQEMLQLALQFGFSHDKTVMCSQELDKLLNKYRAIQVKQTYAIHSDMFISKYNTQPTHAVV
ncbi:aspartyl-phosphate phosphatase Spo0E family protein [Bacillus spongiae]|uniref:Aspartyl-phosphate phosphatase Spo0E family protein n=1 Tax=Bacillus spongiae TaxID=2683610 RepID=A0ABU8HJV8_9BACI